MVARLLTGLFLYCLWQTRGRKGQNLICSKLYKNDMRCICIIFLLTPFILSDIFVLERYKNITLKRGMIMTKKQMKQVIFMGVGCVILLIAGIIYSLLFNDARWVKNMDMSNYVFSIKDIPMLIVGALIAIYVLYVTVIFFKNAFSKNFKDKNYSRTVSSYWGLCGIFGFLGFSGFWTYFEYGKIYPFVFFIFFGFFGFFFEGKLSHTLEDELFLENKRKAEINAYKVGFKLLFIVIWLMAIGMFSRNVEWCAIFMLISVSLIYALVIFLSNYLLYRYEKGE